MSKRLQLVSNKGRVCSTTVCRERRSPWQVSINSNIGSREKSPTNSVGAIYGRVPFIHWPLSCINDCFITSVSGLSWRCRFHTTTQTIDASISHLVRDTHLLLFTWGFFSSSVRPLYGASMLGPDQVSGMVARKSVLVISFVFVVNPTWSYTLAKAIHANGQC